VLLEVEGKVLLVRRKHDPYRGWWMLPAGFVEYGEYAADTALREAREETGLEVELTSLFGLYFGTDDPRNVAHLAVYRAKAVGGAPRAGDDAAEVAAFAPEALPSQIAFRAHREALADWVALQALHAGDAAAPLDVAVLGGPVRRPRAFLAPRGRGGEDAWPAPPSAGPAPPRLLFVVVEIPRGDDVRWEYDPSTGAYRAGPRLHAPLPLAYGWVPATLGTDGEPLDVLVDLPPEVGVGSVVVARPIGLLCKADGDHKVLALPVEGPGARASVVEIEQTPDLSQAVLAWFPPTAGVEGWSDAAAARLYVAQGMARWTRHRSIGPRHDAETPV
jgi:ADP-ribose pyrophosphatase YjhB (NUDIX family)/inorganic pyrophosphatase